MEEALIKVLNWITRVCCWLSKGRRLPAAQAWVLGRTVGGGKGSESQVALGKGEADRHLYILGASGSGKSRLMDHLVREHIQRGEGFCLVDPHGDLTEGLVAFLCDENQRRLSTGDPLDVERIHLLEPFREECSLSLNPLDPCGGPVHPHIGELVGIFRRFWANSWGPRMEELLRNALLALSLAGLTLVELTPFLTDPSFRSRVLADIRDEAVLAFWSDRYEKLSAASQASFCEPVLNKVGALLADPRLRALFGQRTGGLQLRRLMDEGAWLFVNCSRGQLRDASYLLGSMVVAQLQSAALSRVDTPEADRRAFTLFVDEFQHFRGDDFETILCEARKYRLRLVVAHQHLAQLDDRLVRAIFGNVATQVIFSVAPQDAAVVSRQVTDSRDGLLDLMHQPVGQATVLRRGHLPEAVRVMPVFTPPVPGPRLAAFANELRTLHQAQVQAPAPQALQPSSVIPQDPVVPAALPSPKRGGRNRNKRTQQPQPGVVGGAIAANADPVKEANDD